jgi:hypothetical protein
MKGAPAARCSLPAIVWRCGAAVPYAKKEDALKTLSASSSENKFATASSRASRRVSPCNGHALRHHRSLAVVTGGDAGQRLHTKPARGPIK